MRYSKLLSFELIGELQISEHTKNLVRAKRIVKHMVSMYCMDFVFFSIDQLQTDIFKLKLEIYVNELLIVNYDFFRSIE